jgi:hypothetical protein
MDHTVFDECLINKQNAKKRTSDPSFTIKCCLNLRQRLLMNFGPRTRTRVRLRDKTFPDYNEYLSTCVEYNNFLWWVEFEYNDSWYSNSTQERGHSTHETWVKLVYNVFFQTSLTLNIDKIHRNLCGPDLHTQIHAYLATDLNKWETVLSQ